MALQQTSDMPNADKPAVGRNQQRGSHIHSSLFGLFRIAFQRLWSHRGLMLAITAGFTIAIALVVSIPVYAEAVGYRVLRDEFARNDADTSPLSFEFRYQYLATEGAISWDQVAQLDQYITTDATNAVRMPVQQHGRYLASNKRPLIPANSNQPLQGVNLAFADGLMDQIILVDGQLPHIAADGPVEVLITEALASKYGLQVGEAYVVLGTGSNPQRTATPVRIAGIWRAKDSANPYWFYSQMLAEDIVYMPEESYRTRFLGYDYWGTSIAVWFIRADGSSIRSSLVAETQAQIKRSSATAASLLPGTRLDVSPGGVFGEHQDRVQRLTLLLTVFSIPTLGLAAYFTILIAGLVVQRQRTEIAVLRGRGASSGQILGLYLIEAVLIGAVALGFGLLLGLGAAFIMTWTRSFLDLVPLFGLPIELTPDSYWRALFMLFLLILASLLPALAAARVTIVAYKAERARATRRPFWQRAALDVLLLIPTYQAYHQLEGRGTIAFLGIGAPSGDPFNNPLLLLAPTLFIFAIALVSMRAFLVVIAAQSWIFGQLPGVAAVTAARYLARSPNSSVGPMLLIILTLSLSIFTASMARTLDGHLFDQIYYQVGSDMQISDQGQNLRLNAAGSQDQAASVPADTLDQQQYTFLPVSTYLGVPGVRAATRIASSAIDIQVGANSTKGQFVGVDRLDFPSVAYWRNDYATESLGALMNRLADDPSSVLISHDFARTRGVREGDQLTVIMHGLGGDLSMPVTVAGEIELFPTVYPEDGPIIVGNLDYVFELKSGLYPYDIWLRVDSGVTSTELIEGFRGLGADPINRGFAPRKIIDARTSPDRQGLFGLLSVGFAGAAFLTVLGFLFYAMLSFQRRMVELGMLRAIGLSSRQLGVLLAWEQATMISIGTLFGTLIGVSASLLYIPFFQVRAGEHPQTPPFLVQIAWDKITIIYLVFGIMLLLVVLATLALLRKMKLFQAIKLGESV